jgi:hypothetical protein
MLNNPWFNAQTLVPRPLAGMLLAGATDPNRYAANDEGP